MSLRLRLTRMGAKKRPFYRVVAVDSQKRRDSRALDYLGYYNPMVEPNEVKIDQEKVKLWMQRGAKPTETVQSLLKKSGYTAEG
ncbi:MAG: 30S ribosomal protein S16 [Desulfohalobiaceae bacterium]